MGSVSDLPEPPLELESSTMHNEAPMMQNTMRFYCYSYVIIINYELS